LKISEELEGAFEGWKVLDDQDLMEVI